MTTISAWQPQPEQLKQLAQFLNDSLSGRDQNAQKNAEIMLKQAKSSPDIDNYLCFLLCSQQTPEAISLSSDGYHAARSAAGIMLKNDIKTHYQSISPESQTYIKSTVLLGLQDSNAQIRNYAGNVVTELVRSAGITHWPDVLQQLLSMAGNENGNLSPESQEGAMSALYKVCEDNRYELSQTYNSQRPLDFLIPKILEFTASRVPKVRSSAIGSLSLFIPEKSPALMQNLDTFLSRLFELASDSSDEVKKQICRAIIHVAEVAPSKIAPHMQGLVDYMITQQRSVDDPELALDAAEFWLSTAEDRNLREYLAPYLPKIVPVLLECMVYSEDDVLRLEAEVEDAEEEDREEDIKPQFATSKSARSGAGSKDGGNANGISLDGADDDLSDGELEEYDEEDVMGDPEDQWNLRKCSAAALDTLSGIFPQLVFETTLPYLKTNLTHEDWPNREAAVLSIGAIAEGCMEFVEPNLPELVPFLVTLLSDTMPVVRQITCWSLGRYSAWAAHLEPAGKEQFFLPMMDGILKRMLDDNKRVQEAAASAFAHLEEKAGSALANPKYCEVIARQFSECFAKYKDKNMFILYDCVETLAEHVGPNLAAPELVHYLMSAIMKRWEKVPDESREIFPLFECLSFVAAALGNTFVPYAGEVFSRCIRLIYQNLQDSLKAANHFGALDTPDKDFLVTSLDLLSATIQALDSEKAIQLLQSPEATQQQANMFDLLIFCLEDGNIDVRQSAYALLGDCAIFVFPLLSPYLSRALPVLIAQLDLLDGAPDAEESGHPVKNNACWSCGEITMRGSAELLTPLAQSLLSRLFAILDPKAGAADFDVPRSLQENAAIALGRLGAPGNGCAALLAPHLATFAPPYLKIIGGIEWTDEKAQSMAGFTEMVLLNPGGLETCLVEYLVEISRASGNIAAIEGGPAEGFGKVLALYKANIPNFDGFLQQLPPQSVQTLRQAYAV